MFDIGWAEMLVIAVVLIVVVGPKELPGMLRTFGKTTSKLRVMANDFRKQFDEALKEAELDDLKSLADDARKLNPKNEIRKALSPMEKAAQDVRAGLDTAMKPTANATRDPAPAVATAQEPAKAGPAAMPGEGASAASTSAKANGAAKPAAAAKAASAKSASAKPAPARASARANGAAKTSAAKPKAPAKPAATRAAPAKAAAPKAAPAKPAARPKSRAAAKSSTGGTSK